MTPRMMPAKEDLFDAYRRYCRLAAGKKLDLSEEGFFYPTTLLPLGIHAKRTGKALTLPKNADVANYVSIIVTPKAPGLLYSKSYMPIISFPQEQSRFDPIYSAVVEICEKGRDIGGSNAFRYFLGELCQNVYDHSDFEHAHLMVQRYRKLGFVEIVIVDDGITIPGSYERHRIGGEDNELLRKALSGDSTKPETERGFGLGTSIKLLTEVMGGQVFLVSRKGSFYVDSEERRFFKLAEEQGYGGTLIAIRIAYPLDDVPNEAFYDAIKS